MDSIGGTISFVQLEKVSRIYRQSNQEFVVLKEVTFDLQRGSFVVILGPSGSGKSTLLHLLGGMDRPSSGLVKVDGADISKWKSDQLSQYRRTKVGFVFQSYNLLASQSALENVTLPLLASSVAKSDQHSKAMELLKRVGLEEKANLKINQLSGGQAQRVAIARALAANPDIILADEPTGNLDSASGQQIMTLLASLVRDEGRLVIVVTHNEEFIPLADRVIRLRDGQIQSDEAKANMVPVEKHTTDAHSGKSRSIRVLSLFNLARKAITTRLARSILTSLGVAIGVTMMVLLIGIGAGIKANVVKGISSLGPLTMIHVTPKVASNSFGPPGSTALGTQVSSPITSKTLSTLSHLSNVRGAYVAATYFATIGSKSNSGQSLVLTGLAPKNLWSIKGILPKLKAGHFPNGSQGVVIPLSLAKSLVPTSSKVSSLLGQKINIRATFQPGSFGPSGITPTPSYTQTMIIRGFSSSGSSGYISYSSAMSWAKIFANDSKTLHYPGVNVITKTLSSVRPLVKKITNMGYNVVSLDTTLKSISTAFSFLEAGLGALGGIALVVAGLMIGVVMSMSVLEKKREIGILRAIGIRRKDVSRLFLSQAFIIGLFGGVVGVIVADGAGSIINAIVQNFSHSKASIFGLPWWLILLGIALGAGSSVLAGLIPARRAASLNPVDALHQE